MNKNFLSEIVVWLRKFPLITADFWIITTKALSVWWWPFERFCVTLWWQRHPATSAENKTQMLNESEAIAKASCAKLVTRVWLTACELNFSNSRCTIQRCTWNFELQVYCVYTDKWFPFALTLQLDIVQCDCNAMYSAHWQWHSLNTFSVFKWIETFCGWIALMWLHGAHSFPFSFSVDVMLNFTIKCIDLDCLCVCV